MALVVADRVQETTTTTGTGTYTLAGAKAGFQSFAAVGDGSTTYYACTDGTDYEVGIGTYTATGTTLARTTIIESSNSDLAVSWGAGSKDIFVTSPADKTLLVGRNLYVDNPSSATMPSASGTNAIAIGDGASSAGDRGMAFGSLATASGVNSVALGRAADSSGLLSAALGFDATSGAQSSLAMGYSATTATGLYSTAVGRSYASGTDSFAASVANNTSTYGATGAYSLAIGRQSKATALGAAAFGYTARADGNYSVALGRSFANAADSFAAAIGDSSGTYGAKNPNSVAIGQNANAGWDNSIAIGTSAATGATNQIALGGTANQVKISGTYTLPTSDGTNGQVLTTDGAGAVTFADAGGNLELYAENPSTPTAPSATGANAVAIGDQAIASGDDSLAFGEHSDATAARSFSFGFGATATHTGALALGTSRAFAADAVAIGIDNNSTSYGASGANSIAMGYQAKATGGFGVAIGQTCTANATGTTALGIGSSASGNYSTAIGRSVTADSSSIGLGYIVSATGLYSVALGTEADATGTRSMALGSNSVAATSGKLAYAGGRFSADGDAQTGIYVLRSDTTDATAEALTADNSSAGTDDQIILPNNSAYSFSGTIIARQQASGGSDYASWEIKGALLRDANAASTVLGNGIVNKLYATAGASAWAVALTADTTNGGLKVEVTGAAATNIRWVATVNTSEVTYA